MRYAIEALHNLIAKAYKRANARVLRRKEKRLQSAINGHYTEQQKIILKGYKRLQSKSLSSDLDVIFDALGDDELIKDIVASQKEVQTLGALYRIRKDKLSRIGINFKVDHPLAVEFLKDKPLELAKMSQTTKEHVKPLLVNAMQSGTSPTELARELSENFAFSESRSLMISVHELGDAYEHGNYIPLQDAQQKGYNVSKKWQTVNDDNVTDECQANQDEADKANDNWIDLDDEFPSGDDRPPRSKNPRCRCTMLDRIT